MQLFRCSQKLADIGKVGQRLSGVVTRLLEFGAEASPEDPLVQVEHRPLTSAVAQRVVAQKGSCDRLFAVYQLRGTAK
jgi:hypothetical protein